jgi:hypothetical protein
VVDRSTNGRILGYKGRYWRMGKKWMMENPNFVSFI